MIRWLQKGKDRHPARTWLIRIGILLFATSGTYLLFGISGLLILETEAVTWNNIRIISGVSILGCLIAAVGYGNE